MTIAILTATIAIAHFSGFGYTPPEPPPEEPTTAYLVEMPTHEQTTEAEEHWDEPYVYTFKAYTVNGAMMPYEWQTYLYARLEDYGIPYWFCYAMAQIYGESRFDPYADNGLDKGLCQFRAAYWDERAAQAGIAGANIYDPYAQLRVYAMMAAGYLYAAGYDVGRALSMYYLGYDGYAPEYVDYIMGLFQTIRVVW